MNDIKSFTLYREIFKLIDTIKPIEKRNDFLGQLTDFYFKDKKPNFKENSIEEIIWENISKPIIAYKSKCLNGAKGGRPKKTESKTETESESKTTSDVIVFVNDNVNVLESNKGVIGGKEKTFKKPSISEIQEYCKERENNVDAESFYDFYESKGWKVGNQKMKNWKASVRTWERRQEDKPKKKSIKDIAEEVRVKYDIK